VIALISTRVATLAAALIAAALLLALTLSPQAHARAHSAACPHSTTNRSGHGAHSCAAGAGKGHHKGKARKHRHHHEVGSRTPTNGGGQTKGPHTYGGGTGNEDENGGEESGTPTALCEDGSAPGAVEEGENGGEEGFVCEDGSEPACTEGLTPVVSSDGLQVLCEAVASDKS
jgi:hypothetical protein